MVASGLASVGENAGSNRRDVTVVDGCGLGCAVGPADRASASDRRSPPVECVRGEHPRSDYRRDYAGIRDQLFDVRVEFGHRVGLLEERMPRAMRGGEKNDAPDMPAYSLDSCGSGGERQ